MNWINTCLPYMKCYFSLVLIITSSCCEAMLIALNHLESRGPHEYLIWFNESKRESTKIETGAYQPEPVTSITSTYPADWSFRFH